MSPWQRRAPSVYPERSYVNSWFHAQSAAKKWGGTPDDYIEIEEFIDSSKRVIGDARHRSVYHHTLGVWLVQELFGQLQGTAGPKRLLFLGVVDLQVKGGAVLEILFDLLSFVSRP